MATLSLINKHDSSVISVYVTVNYIITALSLFIDIAVILIIYRFTPASSKGYRNHLVTVMVVNDYYFYNIILFIR